MNQSALYTMDTSLSTGNPEYPLNCQLQQGGAQQRLSKRIEALQALDLLDGTDTERWPVFDESAQTAARLLAAPLAVVSVFDRQVERFKAAVGLSRLGLMNPLSTSRELAIAESFGIQVVDSCRPLILHNATAHSAFANSLLVQQYGIQAYLGVPLVTSQNVCIGVLAILDTAPRQFTAQDVAVLELNARWSVSEIERDRLTQSQASSASSLGGSLTTGVASSPSTQGRGASPDLESALNAVRISLISQLTQDLRNPLTSIMGMASMLSREIYGPLTEKQREYSEIVRSSSQELLSLVDEIIDLGVGTEDYRRLTVAPVDLEMLTQQAFNSLEELAEAQQQKIQLSIEPSSRIWNLDKSKVKQLLYHLIFSIIHLGSEGNTIRVHVSRKDEQLNIAVWVSNPWLGEGLPQAVVSLHEKIDANGLEVNLSQLQQSMEATAQTYDWLAPSTQSEFLLPKPDITPAAPQALAREELGLLLAHQLVEIHRGKLELQGSLERGYRYIITLPARAQQPGRMG
ncbi:MAG: GAF domain-containing sensor histidine kinase [Cyanobacteria bacterium P01_H01_bin.119]